MQCSRRDFLQGTGLAGAALALDGCALFPRARASEKRVFAHYMVCLPPRGGETTVEDYKQEMRYAQSLGIDGFALNCGGWSLREPSYKARSQQIYQAAKELGTGFQLMISADYCCGLTEAETRDMVETFRSHPNQFRFHGRQVFSTFAGGAFSDTKRDTAKFLRETFTGRNAVCYVPFYYPSPAAEMPNQAMVDQVFNRYHEDLDGFFHFGAAGDGAAITAANHRLAQKWLAAGKIFMASVTPFYRGANGNFRTFETRGFEGMAQEWEGAIRDNATWVEIVTWNDFGEDSYICPFAPGRKQAATLLDHTAYAEASAYYIAWFKKGVPPPVTKDRMFAFYRPHLKSVPGVKFSARKDKPAVMGFPDGVQKLRDEIFVTVFLTAPAEVTIHSGDSVQTQNVSAGVHHLSVPLHPGVQRFALARKGSKIAEKTGELPVSDKEAVGNFNMFSCSL